MFRKEMNKALSEYYVELKKFKLMRYEIVDEEYRSWRGLLGDFDHLFWYIYAIGRHILLRKVAVKRDQSYWTSLQSLSPSFEIKDILIYGRTSDPVQNPLRCLEQ